MGLLFRTALLVALLLMVLSWTSRGAEASVTVAPADEDGYWYLALSGEDASNLPAVRNLPSGAALLRQSVRTEPNASLYRVGPCNGPSFEVSAGLSYGVYACDPGAGADEVRQLVLALDAIGVQVDALAASLVRLNATDRELQGGVSDLVAELNAVQGAVHNATLQAKAAADGVAGLGLPRDVATARDVRQGSEDVSAAVREHASIPAWAIGMMIVQLTTAAGFGYVFIRRPRGPAGPIKPAVTPGGDTGAVTDELTERVRRAMMARTDESWAHHVPPPAWAPRPAQAELDQGPLLDLPEKPIPAERGLATAPPSHLPAPPVLSPKPEAPVARPSSVDLLDQALARMDDENVAPLAVPGAPSVIREHDLEARMAAGVEMARQIREANRPKSLAPVQPSGLLDGSGRLVYGPNGNGHGVP